MRWPWSKQKAPLFVVEPAEPGSADEAVAAVERAKRAVRKAETNGDIMHGIAKAIYGERQRNNFSGAIYRSMRRRES